MCLAEEKQLRQSTEKEKEEKVSLLLSLFVAVVKNKSITTADGDRRTYVHQNERGERSGGGNQQ